MFKIYYNQPFPPSKEDKTSGGRKIESMFTLEKDTERNRKKRSIDVFPATT